MRLRLSVARIRIVGPKDEKECYDRCEGAEGVGVGPVRLIMSCNQQIEMLISVIGEKCKLSIYE